MTGGPSTGALILDIQALQSELHYERGIVRYVRDLTVELLPLMDGIRAMLLNPDRPYPHDMPLELQRSGKVQWGGATAFRRYSDPRRTVYWLLSPFDVLQTDPTLPAAAAAGASLVSVCFDLIPLLHERKYLRRARDKLLYQFRLGLVKSSGLVLTISESARRDVVRHLGLAEDQVVCIGTGVSAYFNPHDERASDEARVRAVLGPNAGEFLFTVLGEDPRKNLDRLLAAYALLPHELRSRYRLVIGGKYAKQTIESVRAKLEPPLRDRVHFTGYISDATLRALYRSCRLFVFPSLYEGFGLPLAEAMLSGASCVSSNTSSLPEILDLEEATFDPESVASIAGCIERGLTDEALRRKLLRVRQARAESFTWKAVAQRAADAILTRFFAEAPARRRTPGGRLSVGFVGPFPPLATGVATYNLRITEELAKHVDLHLIYTSGSDPERLARTGAARLLPLSSLGDALSPYRFDRLIYTVGNSVHHLETYERMLRHPGILWLHDTHLVDICYLRAAVAGLDFASVVTRMYGPRTPPFVKFGERFDAEAARRWGIRCALELGRAAERIIVHSRHAAEMLRLDVGPGWDPSRVHVIPHAIPAPPEGYRKVRDGARPPHVVVSFGLLHRRKLPETIIGAVALLAEEIPVELRFVGKAKPAQYRSELEKFAEEAGVAECVRFLGPVDEDGWWRQMAEADCAVQLRDSSNGETSGCVCECLAAGVPVITNIESCRELPPGTVTLVSPRPGEGELCRALSALLSSREALERTRAAAGTYASKVTVEYVVECLLEVLKR